MTLSFWGLWVQIRQTYEFNQFLAGPGEKFPRFSLVVLFTVLSIGLYFVYHEFRTTRKIHVAVKQKPQLGTELCTIPLTILGLSVFVDLYKQFLLNQTTERTLERSEAF